jgi:hypothetical protein
VVAAGKRAPSSDTAEQACQWIRGRSKGTWCRASSVTRVGCTRRLHELMCIMLHQASQCAASPSASASSCAADTNMWHQLPSHQHVVRSHQAQPALCRPSAAQRTLWVIQGPDLHCILEHKPAGSKLSDLAVRRRGCSRVALVMLCFVQMMGDGACVQWQCCTGACIDGVCAAAAGDDELGVHTLTAG